MTDSLQEMDGSENVKIVFTAHLLISIKKRKENIFQPVLHPYALSMRVPVGLDVRFHHAIGVWMDVCALSCKMDGTTQGWAEALMCICESESG